MFGVTAHAYNNVSQKSRRWCLVELGDQESARETIAALEKIKVNNKPIFIKNPRVKSGGKTPTKAVECTDQILDLLSKKQN